MPYYSKDPVRDHSFEYHPCASGCIKHVAIYEPTVPILPRAGFNYACGESLSIHLSIYLSIHPSIYLPISLCIHSSVCLSVCPSICLSVYLSVCPSVCLSPTNLSMCLSIYLSFHLDSLLRCSNLRNTCACILHSYMNPCEYIYSIYI